MPIPTSHCQFIMTRLTALSIAVQANIRTLGSYMEDPTDSARLRDFQRTSKDLDNLVNVYNNMGNDYFLGDNDQGERDEADYQAYLDARDREVDSKYAPERFDTSAE
jgi:hypothetical protein